MHVRRIRWLFQPKKINPTFVWKTCSSLAEADNGSHATEHAPAPHAITTNNVLHPFPATAIGRIISGEKPECRNRWPQK